MRVASPARPLETLEATGFSGSFGPAVEPGIHGCADVARLKAALATTNQRIEETLDEVATTQLHLKDSKVQQEAEANRLREVFEALTVENKKLQVSARSAWSSTWRLQAALRAHEEEVELQSEELGEKQRRLEQENARLRKEAAAGKARLLAWRQMQKRGAGPERRQGVPPPKTASGSSSQPRATSSSPLRSSTLTSRCRCRDSAVSSNEVIDVVPQRRDLMEDPDVEEAPLEIPCSQKASSTYRYAESDNGMPWPADRVAAHIVAGSATSIVDALWPADRVDALLPVETANSEVSTPASSSCGSRADLPGRPRAATSALPATPENRRPARRCRSQEMIRVLSPAAREATDVSARVRLRALEALRGLGLRGERRTSSGHSSPRGEAASVQPGPGLDVESGSQQVLEAENGVEPLRQLDMIILPIPARQAY